MAAAGCYRPKQHGDDGYLGRDRHRLFLHLASLTRLRRGRFAAGGKFFMENEAGENATPGRAR